MTSSPVPPNVFSCINLAILFTLPLRSLIRACFQRRTVYVKHMIATCLAIEVYAIMSLWFRVAELSGRASVLPSVIDVTSGVVSTYIFCSTAYFQMLRTRSFLLNRRIARLYKTTATGVIVFLGLLKLVRAVVGYLKINGAGNSEQMQLVFVGINNVINIGFAIVFVVSGGIFLYSFVKYIGAHSALPPTPRPDGTNSAANNQHVRHMTATYTVEVIALLAGCIISAISLSMSVDPIFNYAANIAFTLVAVNLLDFGIDLNVILLGSAGKSNSSSTLLVEVPNAIPLKPLHPTA
ncbi:hypothetical protein RI367_007194 [Sorochytrium milnesiophthora]